MQAVTASGPIAWSNTRVEAGDYDGDGKDDIYLVAFKGGSGMTGVHVLDTASKFTS